MQITTPRSRVVAVLGPTNTGKTHLAMERMLGHASGMIGFPLRLLARENYDRAVRVKGRSSVALITGEEKIVPPGARYFLCTVEAMPIGRRTAFLGVDEIQICADPERGHVFTQRLLGARGEDETMFMGAETIRPLLRRLIPEAEFITRPRFSRLTYTGQRKIHRLAPRSAIVAFSAADVYAIAELVRRQRGGAAVVLGALSPRTRNAQVAMYQAGEVDYLVATDAIGMGLNMDVNHVAFADTRKFDGHVMRDLTAAEMAQIGGRAGRHMNDGTFGTTADVGALDDRVVERIENHEFDALKQLYWRNENLRFTSLETLRRCLAETPEQAGLTRAPEADDERVLAVLCKDSGTAALAVDGDGVRTLWEVCRIPDFRKMMSDGHARLLARIYGHLMTGDGRLPVDWIAGHVSSIDRIDGDIETLAGRIADIRTWTTIAFHGDWLDDAAHWQGLTRKVEDRLSDALHQGLNQRFVDRRTALLVKEMKDRRDLIAVVNRDGEVLVEGHFVGRLEGFRFQADGGGGARGTAIRAVGTAAERALRGEIARRVAQLTGDGDDAFSLARQGGEGEHEEGDRLAPRILWRGVEVGRLAAGDHILQPAVEALAGGLLEPRSRDRIRARLAAWVEAHLKQRLEPLFDARRADLRAAARGLVFQLSESLGSMPRRSAAAQIESLNREDRKALRALGVRLGRESVYLPALLKPGAIALRGLLWAVRGGREPPPMPAAGRVSVPMTEAGDAGFLEAVGYRVLGGRAVRIDIIERLAARAWTLSRQESNKGSFGAGPELLNLAGCGAQEMTGILKSLGYRASEKDGDILYSARRQRPKRPPAKRIQPAADTDSPFSKLRHLTLP